jgi:hypothetical protein
MRRREFIAGLGGAATVGPLVALAQPALPIIGYLQSGSPEASQPEVRAFSKGLNESGFVDGTTRRYRPRGVHVARSHQGKRGWSAKLASRRSQSFEHRLVNLI